VWLFYQGGQPQDFNTTEIYYRTWAAGRWTPEIRLTDNQVSDSSPSVFEAQDGKIWLFWRTGRGSNYNSYEICYRTFDGRAWSPPQNLTRNEVGDFRPCALQTREGTIWTFWSRGRGYDFSSYEVYSRTFTGGQWSEERRLTRNEVMDFNPAAAQTRQGDLWLVWSSQAEGQSHLRAQRYHRGKWHPPRTLTADLPGSHFNPTILEDEKGRLWLAWDSSRDRLRSFEVYYRTSADGVRWSPAASLTRSSWNRNATLLAGPKGAVWAFWSGGQGKRAEIFFSPLSLSVRSPRPKPPAPLAGGAAAAAKHPRICARMRSDAPAPAKMTSGPSIADDALTRAHRRFRGPRGLGSLPPAKHPRICARMRSDAPAPAKMTSGPSIADDALTRAHN